MIKVDFYYDPNSLDLCCRLTEGRQSKTIRNQKKVYELFGELDDAKIKSVRKKNGNVSFLSENVEITLNNYADFKKTRDILEIPNLHRKIKQSLEMQAIARNAGKRVVKVAKSKPVVATVAGALVFGVLMSTIPGITKEKAPEKPSISYEVSDEDYNPNKPTEVILTSGEDQETIIRYEDIIATPTPAPEEIVESAPVPTEEVVEEKENLVRINIYEELDVEKKNHAYDNYHETVEKYASMYGLSSNIPMAMLTQESGGYITENLMQIIFSSWEDQVISVYNFKTGQYDNMMLSSTKSSTDDLKVYSKKDLKDPEINIKLGIAMLRSGLDLGLTGDNLPAVIVMYNQGYGNLQKILRTTSEHTGKSIKEIVSNPADTTFLNYTNVTGVGDPDYFEHCIQFLLDESGEAEMWYKVVDDDGNIKDTVVNIEANQKHR